MKVSVIIPAYNMEKYIRQCLDSLLGQTLDDIELICVDDGSTDSTLSILREYEQRDKRVSAFTQENQYSGVARNNGMKHATGEYLVFFDSDDFAQPDMLQAMYEKCKATDADLCACASRFYHTDTGEYTPLPLVVESMLPKREPFSAAQLGKNAFRFTSSGSPNKMFRRELIEKNHIQYATTRVAQDLPFVCLAVALAKRICTVVDKPYYNYRTGTGTNALAQTFRWPLACANAHTLLRELLISHGVFEQYKPAYENFVAFEIERYAKRYSASDAAFKEYHDWYHEKGQKLYDIHLSSLDAGTLSNLLMTFEGVTLDMDSEAARAAVGKNIERYKALYQGHKKERLVYTFKRLRGIEGFPRAAARMAGFAMDALRGR